MTFLMSPRLVFSGRFLSDVSTINNANPGGDVGWNPQGGAAFEFLNCRISGAYDGEAVADDAALGYALGSRNDRSSAKMVDLDPDWQAASEIWALWVRVFDPVTGELAFMGRYGVAAFRDLWLRQVQEVMQPGGPPNGQPVGARYVSTLRELSWGPAADRSVLLSSLRKESPAALSINIHQFGYFYTVGDARYRTASLVGSIGPHFEGDAQTAIVGRRLQGVPLNATLPCFGAIDFAVAADGGCIGMDLGHALPIANVDGVLTDMGIWPALPQLAGCKALVLGLAQADFKPWGKPAKPVEIIGEVNPFVAGWYAQSGGIVEFSLAPGKAGLAGLPMALYGRIGNGDLVAITHEIDGGLFVRADNFVFRMEAGEQASSAIYVSRFGVPAANVTVYLSPQAPPTPSALKLPQSVTTDASGRAFVTLAASDPGNPRKGENPGLPSPDGQVYVYDYSPLKPGPTGARRDGTGLTTLDVLVVHVFQQIEVPAAPNWEDDVQPILADYAALYPIMSQHLFNIADYDQIVAHRTMLRLAFSRNINDSNYMPVTRDLSAGKRAIIIKWLNAETEDPGAPLRRRAGAPNVATTSVGLKAARTPGPEDFDAKRDSVAPFKPPTLTGGKK